MEGRLGEDLHGVKPLEATRGGGLCPSHQTIAMGREGEGEFCSSLLQHQTIAMVREGRGLQGRRRGLQGRRRGRGRPDGCHGM